MKFLVFIVLCLWDSKITNYDIMDASPFKRDIIKELSEACKKAGIKFCGYYSIVDWHHPQAQAPLYPKKAPDNIASVIKIILEATND